MSASPCERIGLAELSDYAAGDLSAADADALEAHLFSCAACGARAEAFESMARAIPAAARTARVNGFVSETVLNQLARDGVRLRTFVLTPGAVVPCAVWDDDELMALRMRGDFRDAREFTMSQYVGGQEVTRVVGELAPTQHGEVTYVVPAEMIRELPETEVEVRLTVHDGETARTVGHYTLAHGGALHRR